MRRYDRFLIVLVALGLLSLGAGFLVIALILSIIGIPLAYVVLALPSLALVLGLGRVVDLLLLRRVLPDNGVTGFIAIALVLALLAGVSFMANQTQRSQMLALQSGDHDDLGRPLPQGTLAYVSQAQTLDCSDLCLRLLLTGQAQKVLVAEGGAAQAETLDPATPAQSWHIEDRPTCPSVSLGTAENRMRIAGEPAGFDAPRADLLMGAGIAAGHCLIGAMTTLAEADVVITDLILRESTSPKRAGFSLGADLIDARRRAVWVKSDGGLTEQARWTHVSGTGMYGLALPLAHVDMDGRSNLGFVRADVTGFARDPGFDAFASQTLGLRLSLSDLPPVTTPSGADPLLDALQKPGTLDANTLDLAKSRVQAMGLRSLTTEADRTLYLQLLTDPRVDLEFWFERSAWALLRDGPPDFAPTVAKLGFARLDRQLLPEIDFGALSYAEQNDEMKRASPIRAEIRTIANVLAQLPDTALQPHGPTLFALALDRENRTASFRLLSRLDAFGAPGARALVDLLADAKTVDPRLRSNQDRWQHAYLAAMIGLCRMGQDAAPVLPDLLNLVDAGDVDLSSGPYGRLSIATLVRLGHSADAIVALAARPEFPMPASIVEQAIAVAQDARNCAF